MGTDALSHCHKRHHSRKKSQPRLSCVLPASPLLGRCPAQLKTSSPGGTNECCARRMGSYATWGRKGPHLSSASRRQKVLDLQILYGEICTTTGPERWDMKQIAHPIEQTKIGVSSGSTFPEISPASATQGAWLTQATQSPRTCGSQMSTSSPVPSATVLDHECDADLPSTLGGLIASQTSPLRDPTWSKAPLSTQCSCQKPGSHPRLLPS